MAAPFLEAARYRACAPRRACIRSAHPEKTRLRRARPAKAGALRSFQPFSAEHSVRRVTIPTVAWLFFRKRVSSPQESRRVHQVVEAQSELRKS